MVHYKRKHVRPCEPPVFLHDEAEVWGIEKTGEVFTDYDSFLHRIDFYSQRKFTCEITGHSGLTFFEALNSELHGSRDIETNFPENLREHVLRKVQFSQVGRLDDLVNEVYNHFRRDFFPGENVIAISHAGVRFEGTIREKVSFPPAHDRDGNVIRPAISNYFVKLHDERGEEGESFFDDHHITRDRKVFSKLLLRSFLKHSITREPHHHAVWTVKENIASEYKIPTELPHHLQPHVIAEQKKLLAHQRKMAANGAAANLAPGHTGTSDQTGHTGSRGQAAQQLSFSMVMQEPRFVAYQQGTDGPTAGQLGDPYASTHVPLQSQEFAAWQPHPTEMPPPQKPQAPPKYPIDDLELPPKNNGVKRPALKFVAKPACHEHAKDGGTNGEINGETNGDTNGEPHYDAPEIRMSSVGLLLEIWNTLNVHEEVFLLDSFTFDDILDAMRFTSHTIECELFTEIHCAVLKQLVNEEGELLVELPELDEDEEEDEEDESAESTPEPEPEPRRTTRGSLRKSEAEALKKERSPSVDPNQPAHCAAEMLANDSWVERLKARDFRSGGWQFIMVGILRQLALSDRHAERCEAILRELAPLDMPPDQETARTQYAWLDVNMKIQALQIICMLAVTTKALREYLERCSEDMTELRKAKIEWQRTRKPLVEELRELDEQRKALVLEEMPPAPDTNGATEETDQQQMQDVTEVAEVAEIINDSSNVSIEDEENSEDSEDEVSTRALRRGQERKRKRDEVAARQEREAKEKAAAKAAQAKLSPKMRKLLRDIDKKKDKIKECEDKIGEMDSDLREANCQRTKLLGRDRFSYRYWWFEKNGMPFAGMPGSSAAARGYANARIWVQGPDDMERAGFLELRADEMASYKAAFGVDMQGRRDLEEGPTQLGSAREWGYIDDPAAVDELAAWLDDRGRREKELRKELLLWRDHIVTYMARLQAHLAEVEEDRREREADGEERSLMLLQQATRVSTRTKTYVDVDASRRQCLAWHNDRAVREQGHLHSEQPRPKGRKKGVAETKKAAAAAAAAPSGRKASGKHSR